MHGLIQSLRYTIRVLLKSPGFAITAVLIGFLCLTALQRALGSEPSPTPTPALILDEHTRTSVIDAAAQALEDKYVFPDLAKKMADKIRQDNASKTYDTITTGEDLSRRLTEDLWFFPSSGKTLRRQLT